MTIRFRAPLVCLAMLLAASTLPAQAAPKKRPGDAAGSRRGEGPAAPEGHLGRRDHRVPARQRPARAALPGPDQADGHRQHHLPRRLAPRGLRRDRHGAPARAHALQGHAEAPQRPAGADRARRAARTARPGSTAPTTSRRSRRPTRTSKWALELEADRMVNSFIAKKDLDSEMTVVRNEFEMGENDPARDPRRSASSRRPSSGTTTASRRSARAPTSRTCRSSACRPSTGRTTSRTTRCSSSPASSTRRRRSRSSTGSSADPRRPGARCPTTLHARADAGRRAAGDAAPRRRRPGHRRRVPRARRAREPGRRRRRHPRRRS